jgi:ATP-binding cassette subfamily C protein CydC
MAIFLGSFDPSLIWLLLCSYTAIGLLSLSLILWNRFSLGPATAAQRGLLGQTLLDAVEGNADMLAFDYEEAVLKQFHTSQNRLSRLEIRCSWLDGIADAGTTWIQYSTLIAVLVLITPKITSTEFPGVNLPLILMAAYASFEAFQALPLTAAHLDEQLTAVERLFQLADTPPTLRKQPETAPLPDTWSISVEQLSFTYPGQSTTSLRDISFQIDTGGQLAIVGTSGMGKSTLAYLLLRFWEFEQGVIRIGEQDIRNLDPDACRSLFSLIDQRTALFYGSVRENLQLASFAATEPEIFEALERAQLLEFVQDLPRGLDTLIGESGQMLSGGERQRLNIARAILQQAPILILDEPSANLDIKTEKALFKTLRPLIQRHTSLMLTHRLIDMEQYDRILVLEHGCIVEAGTHDQLFSAQGIYTAMWREQQSYVELAGLSTHLT